MATERLVFELLTSDQASKGFVAAGRAAGAAADDVKGLQHRLDEISDKSASARVGLAGNKEALDQLDKLDVKLLLVGKRRANPNIKLDGALKANLEIAGISAELDKLGKKGGSAETAAGGLSALAGGGGIPGGGMGALIGAGAVLSPVLMTLGTGLLGFGAAAYGAISPIEKAAQKTGGLAANMQLLNPEQHALATSVLRLGQQYDAFQRSLQPEVLSVFGKGVQLAGSLMHDVQPVAAATGKALGGLLDRVDAEFASGAWQDFFGFMAKTAGPDMQLVGTAFTNILGTLPPLLTNLQPVAAELLTLTDEATRLAQGAVYLEDRLSKLGASSDSSGKKTGGLTLAVRQASQQLIPEVSLAQQAWKWIGLTGSASKDAGVNIQAAGGLTKIASGQAKDYAANLQAVATQITAVMTAESTALATQVTYGGDIVASANDLAAFRLKLKASAGEIGLHTQAQRDSFAAANTYIGDLSAQAVQAVKSGHGVDAAMTAIRDGLPVLDSAKTKNQQYWQEVRTLEGWLARLKSEKVNIKILGAGNWVVTGGGGTYGNKPMPVAAGGMRVTGGIPGVDSVPILAQRDELVVPVPIVKSGAVDHLRGMIPGFGAGGVVGSYSGPGIPGLQKWLSGENSATIRAMSAAVAQAFRAGASSSAGGSAGPGGGAPAANAALARRMFPAYSSGPVWDAWNYVAMRESGWNQFARNPSSGAYGIPQALPPSKMPFAAQAAGGSNPAAQIGWMWNYMAGSYGGPVGAAAHERAFNWYGSGVDAVFRRPTLIGVGERGPEHVRVTPGGGGAVKVVLEWRQRPGAGSLERAVVEIVQKHVLAVAGGDVQAALGAG